MTRIIALANHKGGVGKTTTAAALGAGLASMGRRVLLVDLDAQANLTASFMGDVEPGETIYEALRGEAALPIIPMGERLDLVPSSLDMAGVDIELTNRYSREYVLRKLLKPVSGDYDYILLDCPPSLGLVTVNAFVAANELFIPLTAEALPARGLKRLTDILQTVRENLNEGISLTGIVITRWEGTTLSKTVEERLREVFGGIIFKTRIRKNVALAEAQLYAKGIEAYAPESNGAKDYKALTLEVLEQEK